MPTDKTIAVNKKMRAAATYTDVPYVEAIDWFPAGGWSTYADRASGHPNDKGYDLIARRTAAAVANLL